MAFDDSLYLFQFSEGEMNHAKGKRWAKDKATKEKGPEVGKGIRGGTETAIPDSGGCRSSCTGLCLSRSKEKKEGFSKALDQPDQRRSKASRAFVQSAHGCIEKGPYGAGSKNLSRLGRH